jgi:hypothetical protein
MKKYLLYFVIMLLNKSVVAQNASAIKGVLLNAQRESQAGVPVILLIGGDTLRSISNTKGVFAITPANNRYRKITVIVNASNYNYFEQPFQRDTNNNILEIILQNKTTTLTNIIVKDKSAIIVKQDTITYNADSFKVQGDLPSEALLKKLPGVDVDKDGNVIAQGQQVTKVRVNGKDFFGGDVKSATKDIPVDMIDKVQVIDDYGDQANFTGVRDGDPNKILNYILKKNRNQGYFGNAEAGIGTQDRYMGKLVLNKFKEEQQISINASANNTNQSNFNISTPEIGGQSSGRNNSGGSGSQGGSSFNPMGQMANMTPGDYSNFNNNFNNSGITNTRSIGLNYRDNWGSKITVFGNVVFTKSDTRTIANTLKNFYFRDTVNTSLQNSIQSNNVYNQRLNFNVEYKPDSNNYFKISPQVSIRVRDNMLNNTIENTQSNNTQLAKGEVRNLDTTKSVYLALEFLYNHKFKKTGRTFSFNTNLSNNNTDKNALSINEINTFFISTKVDSLGNQQKINTENRNAIYNFNISYTEPITKKGNLEINYRLNNDYQNNYRNALLNNYYLLPLLDTMLNEFNSNYITNRLGLNWRVTEQKYNYSIGFAAQPANINTLNTSNNIGFNYNIFNYFPVARLTYKFNKNKSLETSYNGRTNQPSTTQLQPIPDLTNAQYIVIGNVNLRPEFSNNFRFRYNNFNPQTGVSIFASVNYGFTNDKIVANTILKNNVQETRYINENGYQNMGLNYNLSKPIFNKKFKIKTSGNYNGYRNILFANNNKYFNNNFLVMQRLNLDITPTKAIDASIGLTYNVIVNTYNIANAVARNTQAIGINSEATFFLPKNFRFNYYLLKTFNNGFANNVSANPFIINAYLEKRFFKSEKLSVKIALYDLLNNNTSITRTTEGNSIVDAQSNKLTQYFMLSANYKISKFIGKQPAEPAPAMHGDRPWRREGMGQGGF